MTLDLERALADSNNFIEHLLENVLDAVISMDENGCIVGWNAEAENIFGWKAEAIIGQKMADTIVPQAYRTAHADGLKRFMKTKVGKVLNKRLEIAGLHKQGHEFPIELTITPSVQNGKYVFHAFARDISERKQIEADLSSYQTELQQKLVQVQKNEERVRRQLEISQAMAATQHEADVLDIIVDEFAALQHTAVYIFSPRQQEDTVVHQLQRQHLFQSTLNPFPNDLKLPVEEWQTLFTGEQPFISANVGKDSRVKGEPQKLLKEAGIQNLAVFPFTAGGNWLGTLMLATNQPDIYPQDSLTYFQALAEQTTVALRAAGLYDKSQAELAQRGREVALATQIAQEIAAAPNLHELYQRIVKEIKEQLGYYHVQLLRYAPVLDTVVLIAGYGEVGQKMKELNHNLPMGVGLIGTAAATGQTVLRSNIAQDPNWLANPLLPNTKGEIAVPIKAKTEVLGVLDVQVDEAGALSKDDQLLLEGLCGQIAIAIESTTLKEEMEGRLLELNLLQQQLSQEGWQAYQQARQDKIGYLYDLSGLQTLTNQTKVLSKSSQKADPNGTEPTPATRSQVSKPLTIRGESIGDFGVEDDPERPLTDDEREIIEAVAKELAEALEAARMFEQTQLALAEQERLASELETVAQVSTAASTILEIDKLLQSVADLAKSSFGLYHAHIYLLNEAKNKLILKAGAGNIGRLMTLEGHEIGIDAESLVARAARTREGAMVNNVRKTLDFLPHPLLPKTRSEMALPMVVGGKLIGVFDLQADREEFFTEEDLKVQTTLAAQIAVAVENANQYAAQVQTATKLREVDQLKSEFLASMSHELRTPLNSIIGFADVLLEGLDGDLNDRMEEDVRLIRDSGDHLRGLIGDILDMSKIEAGRMDLRYEEIDMVQLANDVVATAVPLAQEKNLYLHLDMPDDVRPIQADRTRLRQILWNIVGNAIKFSDKGGVTISLQAKLHHLLCSVRDTGIGIKDEHAGVVFEQFRQIDGGLDRTAGGTGLGMPITKKLVELHGGDIWIESVYGQGSTFLFTIPYKPPQIKQKADEIVTETG